MEFLINYIYVPIVVLVLFGAAIFVHEWGHYIVARLCGLKVEAFAIGFGKPIYAWTNKEGIEYSIRWIPAGGYVKLPQMLTSETLEGEGPQEELPPASPIAKILVAFAGPFMNVVFAFAIATYVFFFGLPIKINPAIIGPMDTASEEYKAGVRGEDHIMTVNGKEAKTWERVFNQVIFAETNRIDVEVDRKGERLTFNLEAKINDAVGIKTLSLPTKDKPYIKTVSDDMPAKAAGVQPNDRIVKFDGITIASTKQFTDAVKERGGKECELIVEREKMIGTNITTELCTLSVTPRGEPGKKGALIGVGLDEKAIYEVQKPGPLPWVLVGEVFEQIKFTMYALANSKKTGVGISDLSGPVGILSVLATQVKADLRLAMKFMILLNLSLAIMNLLPIPVLDGGHIVMAILEKIRGVPLGVRVQEYVTTAFALLLISFMLFVTYADVKRFWLFKHMFTQETEIRTKEDSGPPAKP
ncbi:MAG: RIP metalloprotease RseP, partial [Limisphaerales bacterium]